MKRLFLNLFAFVSALAFVLIIFYFNKNNIFDYYFNSLESLKKTHSLKNDLESGKIIVFGSSELDYKNQKFTPQNFFSNLQIPLRVQGNEGHQEFAILSQLAAFDNKKVQENARVVILLSPGWFTGSNNGTKIPKFLEYMYVGMMDRLYFSSSINDNIKLQINNYVQKNLSLIKEPSYIYTDNLLEYQKDIINKFLKKSIINYLDSKYETNEKFEYKNINIDFEALKIEAKKYELPSTNNNFGINNDFYSRVIAPNINKDFFPFSIEMPKTLEENEEFSHFLILLETLKNYKIKPLFIMQDLHPYVYARNRGQMEDLIKIIEQKLRSYNYEFYNMWTYDKNNYELENLRDMVHLGETGWLKVNQRIIEHFGK